jgi:hypothetical protein
VWQNHCPHGPYPSVIPVFPSSPSYPFRCSSCVYAFYQLPFRRSTKEQCIRSGFSRLPKENFDVCVLDKKPAKGETPLLSVPLPSLRAILILPASLFLTPFSFLANKFRYTFTSKAVNPQRTATPNPLQSTFCSTLTRCLSIVNGNPLEPCSPSSYSLVWR